MFKASPNLCVEFLSTVLGNGQGHISIGSTTQSSIGTCTYQFFEASDIQGIETHLDSLPGHPRFSLGSLANGFQNLKKHSRSLNWSTSPCAQPTLERALNPDITFAPAADNCCSA